MGVTLLSRGELLNKSDVGTTPIRDLRAFCKIVLFFNLSRERESLEQQSSTSGSQVTNCPQSPVLQFLLRLLYYPLAEVRCYLQHMVDQGLQKGSNLCSEISGEGTVV